MIGRPQDYFAFLAILRPVLLSTAATLIVLVFSGIRFPNGFKSNKEVRFLFLFLLVMFVGIPFAVHRGVAFNFVFTIFPNMLVYFLIFLILVNSVKRLISIASVGVLGAVFSSLMYAKDTILTGQIGGRVYASQMYDPNDIAFVFATYLPLTLYFALAKHNFSKKMFYFIAAMSMAAGILITQSRGGILALLAIIMALMFIKTDIWRGQSKVFVVILLIGILIYAFPIVKDRFENIQSDYNITEEGGRIDIWKENLAIFLENPMFGVGANCSAIALGLRRTENIHGLQAWQVPHSSIVQVGVETGLPGLIIYILLNLNALLNFRRLRKEHNSDLSMFAFFLEVSFYGFWTSALFLTHGYSINLFFLLAMSAAMRSLVDDPKRLLSNSAKS